MLREAEYRISGVRIEELRLKPIQGAFDLVHLKAIHHKLFADLYEWAGKERTINLTKRDMHEPWWTARFASHERIGEIMLKASDELRAANFLRGLQQTEFVAGMTRYYIAVNHAHPFAEGNGRSTQTLIQQLAREAGYELRFDLVDRDRWNHAAARSMPQRNLKVPDVTRPANERLMHSVFEDITRPLEQLRNHTLADPRQGTAVPASAPGAEQLPGAYGVVLARMREYAEREITDPAMRAKFVDQAKQKLAEQSRVQQVAAAPQPDKRDRGAER